MNLTTLSVVDKIDDDLLRSFGQLEPDRFLRGPRVFRYRAFGEAIVKGGEVYWQEAVDFFQSATVNSYIGGVTRTFGILGEPARRFAEAMTMEPKIRQVVDMDDFSFGCHQIRIAADDDFNGTPTPEGFHHDGFVYVAIACVATNNVNGATSLIRSAEHDEMLVFDRPMAAGEAIVFDDRAFTHYVTPFTPKMPGRPAYRDAVVLTFDQR